MCGYDPFWIYDWQQEVAYDMDMLGIETYDEYCEYLDNLKNDTQIRDYESREGR